ncbi:hypothetical protein ACFX19_040575 [Malus domestica]
MRYSCSGVACLQRFAWLWRMERTLKKWYVVSGKLMLRVKIADKLYPRKSGYQSSESDASSVFEQVILSGIWLSRFGDRCLFDF